MIGDKYHERTGVGGRGSGPDARHPKLETRARHRRGFSMTEMLVVVTIFAMASLTIAATHINFTRLHRRTANAEALGEDLRFVSELLVRLARNNSVEYPALPNPITTTSSIALLSSTDGSILIVQRFSSGSSVCSGLSAACLGLSRDGGGSWAPITGKNVNIDRFNVYVTPSIDPFQTIGIGSYNNSTQPRVTFLIDATYVSQSLESATLSLQTTVTSRVYER